MNKNELEEQATARLLEEPKPVIDANDVFREARKLHASSMAFYYQQPTHSARHLRRRQSSARMQFASAARGLSSARFKDTAEHAHVMLMQATDSDEEGPAGLQAGACMPKAIVLKPRPAFGSIIAQMGALADALWGQERRRHAALVPLLSSLSIVRRGGSGSGSGDECGERSQRQSRWSTAAAGEAPPPEGAQELTLSDFPASALSGVPASPRPGAGFPPPGESAPSSETSASAPIARAAAEDCGAGVCKGAAAISDQLVFTGHASPVAAATAGGSLAGNMPVVPAGASGRARRLSAPPQLQLSIPSWASDAAAAGDSATGLAMAMTSPKVQWPPPPLLADAAGGSSTRSSHRSSAMGSERSFGMASPVPSVFPSNAVAPQPRPQSRASALPSVSTARSASAASSLAGSAVGVGGTGAVPAVRRSAWQKSPSPKRPLPCAAQATPGAAAVTDSVPTWQQPVEGKPSSKARFKFQLFSLFGLTSRSSAARVAASSASSSMGGSASSSGAGSGADGAALAACSGRSQRVDGGSGNAGGDGLIMVPGLHSVAACSSDDSDDEMMAAVVRTGASFCVGSGQRGEKGGAAGGALHTAALLSPQHYRQGDILCAPFPTPRDASMATLAPNSKAGRPYPTQPPPPQPPPPRPILRENMDSGWSARPATTASQAPASEADARAILTRVARIAAVPTGDAAEPVWEVRPRDMYAHEADEIRLIRVRARAAEATAAQRDLSRRAHSTHAESWRPQGPECGHAFGSGYSHGMLLSRAATPMAAAPQAGLHSPPAAGRAAPSSLNGSSAGDGASLAGCPSPFTLSAVPAAVATGARMAGLSAAAPLVPSALLSANSSGIHSNRPTPSFPRRSLAMGSGKFAAVFGDDGGAGGGSVTHTLLAAKDPSGGGLLISPLCSTAAADASAGAGAMTCAVIPGRPEDPEGYHDSPLDPAGAEGGAGGHTIPHLGAAAPYFRSADNTAGAYQQWQGSAGVAPKSGESSMRRRSSNGGSTGGCAVGSDAEGGPGCGDGGHSGTGRSINQGPLPASNGGLRGPSGGAWPAAGSSTAAARAAALWRAAAPSSGTTSPLQLASASSARLSHGALSGLVLPPPSPPGWAGGQQARLLHQQLPGLQQLQFPVRRGSVDETGAAGAYQQQQRLHSAHRRAGPQSAHQPRHTTASPPPPPTSLGPASVGLRPSSREAGYGGAGPPALVGSGGSRRASTGSLPPRHHSGNPLYVRQAAGNLSLRMGAEASLNAAAAAAAVAACGDDDDDSDSDYDIGYGAMELIPERVGSSGGETSPPASPRLAAAAPAIAQQGLGEKEGKELAAAGYALSTTGTQRPGATTAARYHSDSHGTDTGGISSNGRLSREIDNGNLRGGFVGRLKKKALSLLRRNA
eukprot:XP_001696055.1 predicted protein [Chlamydomonas reinhardtii]